MGTGKKHTIGYRYYVGLHLVMCRQADALLEIMMSSKRAWRGSLAGGRSTFNKPNLFGGDKREGGISGAFDFMLGESTQPVNDYLASVLGVLTPAYRGAVSIVMRRPYTGANTARLPNMKFKLMNVQGIHRGWYPEKAVFADVSTGGVASVYIAWNASTLMSPTQYAAQQTWLSSLVGSLAGTPVTVQRYGSTETSGGIFSSVDGEHTALLDWIAANTPIDETSDDANWVHAFAAAPGFFADSYETSQNFPTGALSDGLGDLAGSVSSESNLDGRRNVIIVLGYHDPLPFIIAPAQAILATIPNLELFAFRLDNPDVTAHALIDNTPIDGVPVIDSNNPETSLSIQSGLLFGWVDMNPAHIIRCLWVDAMRGGVVPDADIGDSFQVEADRFYSERFGLSPRFDKFSTVEQARLDIERHVDCISYRSRITNKIEIKAVRNDYDPVDLPVLDSSIVLDWSGLERSAPNETPNQLTVVYTKRKNGETAGVTRTNIAGVRRSGRTIPSEPVEYLSCTREDLAVQLVLRDLSVQNRPLLTGPLVLAYFPPDLDIGDPFIINEPKLKIDNVVVRVTEINEGDGINNSVTVTIAEDKFALPAADAIGPLPPPIDNENAVAQPCALEIVQEAPYYLLVFDQTQADVDNALLDEPDLGFIMAMGTKPTVAHRSITVGVNNGGGYEDRGEIEFVTSTVTLSGLGPAADANTLIVPATYALEAITANSLALIEDEIVRIDAFAVSGPDVEITIGRGCLDTVPSAHPAGATLVFLQLLDVVDAPSFVGPSSARVKLLTNLNASRLSLVTAPGNIVFFDSRAIRPYPPGALQLNASYAHDQYITDIADVVLTWAHRDRTLQTTPVPEDFTASDIGPEAGVSYRVRVDAMDENYFSLGELDNTNVGTATTYDWNDATAIPDGTNRLVFTVTSEKGAYESWQRSFISLAVLLSPAAMVIELVAGDVVLTWEDQNEGTLQEDDIVIYRDTTVFGLSTLPAIFATLAADTTTYTDTTVAPGNTYYYAVVMRRGTFIAATFVNPMTI